MPVLQIGRDPRLSGEALQAGLTAGLASQGVQVAQFDLATTPACFMSCIIGGQPSLHPHTLAYFLDIDGLQLERLQQYGRLTFLHYAEVRMPGGRGLAEGDFGSRHYIASPRP